MSQRITPHLWYDKEAKEAAEFYVSIFTDSKIKDIASIRNTPSGDTDIVTLDLLSQEFTLISAGPFFKPNPSISFLIACKSKQETDMLWQKLSNGGLALMELDTYPFSELYGWLQDKYGVSWQLMYSEQPVRQRIIPKLMFTGKVAGKAEEAITHYTQVFNNASVGDISRYGKDENPDVEGTIKHASFTLEGQYFAAMDSAFEHKFGFNEAISFIVHCENQAEIDYYWGKLSADPKAEICGWLKDKYGVSWQVTPNILSKLLVDEDESKRERVTQAFLKMKKLDIAELMKAYWGQVK